VDEAAVLLGALEAAGGQGLGDDRLGQREGGELVPGLPRQPGAQRRHHRRPVLGPTEQSVVLETGLVGLVLARRVQGATRSNRSPPRRRRGGRPGSGAAAGARRSGSRSRSSGGRERTRRAAPSPAPARPRWPTSGARRSK